MSLKSPVDGPRTERRSLSRRLGRTLSRLLGGLRNLLLRHAEAGLAFAVRVASAVLAFGLQVMLARSLDGADYGTFITVTTWILVLAGVVVLGFGESALRFIPRYVARHRWRHARAFMVTGLRWVLMASFATGVVLLVSSYAAASPTALIVLMIALGLPFAVLSFFFEGVGRAMGWYACAIVPTYIVQPVVVIVVCGVVLLTTDTLTLRTALIVFIAAVTATSALKYLVVFRPALAKTSNSADSLETQTAGPVAPGYRALWLRASLPLMAVYGIDEVLFYSDILLVGVMSESENVGIYMAAVRCLAIANFIHYAFMLVAARKFSIAASSRNQERLQSEVAEVSRMTFLLTVAAVAITLAAAPFLLQLFGPTFVAAWPVMIVLGLGMIVRSTVGQAFDLLAVTGHPRAIVAISFGCLLTNIFLSALFIPWFGIVGAATATAIAMSVRAAGLAMAASHHLGVQVVAFAPVATRE